MTIIPSNCPFTDKENKVWSAEEPDLKSSSSSVAEPEQESEAPISLFLFFPNTTQLFTKDIF